MTEVTASAALTALSAPDAFAGWALGPEAVEAVA
jgi:hypothetical protein